MRETCSTTTEIKQDVPGFNVLSPLKRTKTTIHNKFRLLTLSRAGHSTLHNRRDALG